MPAALSDFSELRDLLGRRAYGCAFVIPVYNHPRTIRQVASDAAATGCRVWVVDDGSTDETPRALEGLEGVTVIRHEVNRGKGAALRTGMQAAADAGLRWVVTVDADGQHLVSEAVRLLRLVAQAPERPAIVLGCRQGMLAGKVPWTSRWGRRWSSFWVWMAGGSWVSDSQSGFRLYPVPETLQLPARCARFQFEMEVLVDAHRAGIPILSAEVSVEYAPPGGRVSHLDPWTDFWRNTRMILRLMLKRLLPRPALPTKVDPHAP